MFNYILRRLLLLPLTLFCIVLVNFIIINLAPGDPVTITQISPEGATRKEDRSLAFGSDELYLQFREFYGLTLPVLFNPWPWSSPAAIYGDVWSLTNRRVSPSTSEEMTFKDYESLRVALGDKARFVMPILLGIAKDTKEDLSIRRMAARFFIRGGTLQAILGPNLTENQKAYNRKINADNNLFSTLMPLPTDTQEQVQQKIDALNRWYEQNKTAYNFAPTTWQKIGIFFFDTRFCRYMSRVLTLDFGTLRNDSNKTVIAEVVRRFKYSLTLALVPMLVTFFLCQIFGAIMAYRHNLWPDYTLNVSFLILFALPVFVVAPFLIEKVALNHTFPFTSIPIPISGIYKPRRYLRESNLSGAPLRCGSAYLFALSCHYLRQPRLRIAPVAHSHSRSAQIGLCAHSQSERCSSRHHPGQTCRAQRCDHHCHLNCWFSRNRFGRLSDRRDSISNQRLRQIFLRCDCQSRLQRHHVFRPGRIAFIPARLSCS